VRYTASLVTNVTEGLIPRWNPPAEGDRRAHSRATRRLARARTALGSCLLSAGGLDPQPAL